jgi:DNA-binding CsgD family transcriptional regulator
VPRSAAKNPLPPKTQRALILTTPRGKIQFIDGKARRWLNQLFGTRDRATQLPRELCRWLVANNEKTVALPPNGKLRHDRICISKKALTRQSIALAFELVRGTALKESSRRYRDLTSREREVLFWLSQGKTNADIAAILGVASATISKHLERIYPKLGVENRTAASMMSEPSTANLRPNWRLS